MKIHIRSFIRTDATIEQTHIPTMYTCCYVPFWISTVRLNRLISSFCLVFIFVASNTFNAFLLIDAHNSQNSKRLQKRTERKSALHSLMFNSGAMQKKIFHCLFACLFSSFAAKLFSYTHGDDALSLVTEKENESSRENSLAGRLKNRERKKEENQ